MNALFNVRPRMNASGATSMTLRSMYLCTRSTPIISYKRVVQRAQVRIDLLREVAGQEAELLARFDRRTHQQNPADALLLERRHRARHREIGFAGARRTDAEVRVVLLNRAHVVGLIRTARLDRLAARVDQQSAVFDAALNQRFDAGVLQI